MKRKFIFLVMLFALLGGVNWNVLNAQEQQYRIRALSYNTTDYYGNPIGPYSFNTNMYLNINNNDAHASGTNGGVGVTSYSESNSQIFTLEDLGNNTFYIKSIDGYYIYCQSWNVDAIDQSTKSAIGFSDNGDNTFYMMNGTKYFKVERVGDSYYPFCNYTYTDMAAKWVLEEVINDNITPAPPVNLEAIANSHNRISLTWTAGDEYAISYNIYRDNELIAERIEGTSYAVENLPSAETQYCFTVKAVRGNNLSEPSQACATTLVAPKTRDVVFTLMDTYGDGWNGGSLSVTATDGTNEELEFTTGKNLERKLSIAIDATVTVVFNAGTYADEASYRINYDSNDGDVIVASEAYGKVNGSTTFNFTVEAKVPKVEVSTTSIAFGDVRMGDYWAENNTVSETFNVVVKNTTFTGVTCDNTFFEVVYEAGVVTVSCDKTADFSGEQSGTITVAAEGAAATVAVSATAYAPVTPDVIELATNVTESAYTDTPDFATLHDDYNLPKEVNAGSTPDAVYHFTMENEGTLTVNVTGTNAIAAVYKAEDMEGSGPMANNNFKGIVPAPAGETTFEYTFEDVEEGKLSDQFTVTDADGDGKNWELFIENNYVNKHIISYSWFNNQVFTPENYIVTNKTYLITENSRLTWEYKGNNYPDNYAVVISEDGVNFDIVAEKSVNYVMQFTPDYADLGAYAGKIVHIGFVHHNCTNEYAVAIDNIRLTDGSTRNRSTEPQINGVQYPAGEYYLVAAAEEAFTVSIETGSLPEPGEFAYTAPADGATEQNNPKLTWDAAQYAAEYKVYLGTESTLTEENLVATVTTPSYQTEGLSNNTQYFWKVDAVNAKGTKKGEVYSFVTPLDVPQNVAVSASTIVEGETVTVTWNAIENVTYNVYVDDVQVNDEPITATSYELAGLAYNVTTGRNVTVTAVHTLGESPKSDAVNVKVAGRFTVTVTVTDGTNPIEGANVTLKGGDEWAMDELGNSLQYYTLEAMTDANGIAVIENVRLLQTSGYSYYVITAEYGIYDDAYGYIYNYNEIVSGQNYPVEIYMELPRPENVDTDKEAYLVGDDVVLSWDAIAAAKGYNVYKADDEDPLNAELLTETTFTIEDVEYGMSSQYAVTAVYEGLGESSKTTKIINVTGMGSVSGTVTDGTNPIKGVKVVLIGYDETYTERTYTFTTDANGVFTGKVMAGYYTATATRYDFEDYTSNEQVAVNYNETANVNIAMTSYPSATIAVEATDAGDNAVVNWTAEYEKYNVYRRNVATDPIEKLATETTSKEYTDAQWASLENGTYQYGVSALSGGRTVLYEEDFEQGESWTNNYPNNNVRWKFSSEQKVSGNNSIQLYHTTGNELERTYTSPEISIGEATATLKFKYLFKAYMGVYHTIIISVKGSNDVGWFKIYEIPKETLEEFKEIEIPLAGKYNGDNIQIEFKGLTGYFSAIWVDDISIETEAPGVESQITWSNELVKRTALTFNNAAGDNDWSNPANWAGGVLPTAEDNVVVNAVANINNTVAVNNLTIKANLNLKAGAAFTVNGTITLQPGYLYIEDGAQIFQKNEGVNALYKMSIKNPTEWGNNNKSGWQFISSPLLNSDITVFATQYNDNNAPGFGYDLYKYEGLQKEEWVNYKANAFALESGRGYMYSHQARTIVTLNQGTLNPATTNTWELTYAEGNEPANLHLLGNPFTFNMDWSEVTVEDVYNGYATLNADGDNYVYATSGTINVGDGFFVQAIGSEPAMSYGMRGSKEKSSNINVIARGNTGEDNVIINFAGEGEGFRKLQGFNEDNAKIFVSNDGVRYGIANVDEDVAEVELSFVAAQMGNYSISFDINGKFETVTLVDRFTGVETNMMLEDEYTFTATSNDSHNRFVVRLGSAKVDNANFVYQSGDELIIDAEGAIEIIDMMGRVVYSSEMNDGRVNVSNFNNAAYVVRALNEGKVQKVVIY